MLYTTNTKGCFDQNGGFNDEPNEESNHARINHHKFRQPGAYQKNSCGGLLLLAKVLMTWECASLRFAGTWHAKQKPSTSRFPQLAVQPSTDSAMVMENKQMMNLYRKPSRLPEVPTCFTSNTLIKNKTLLFPASPSLTQLI